MTPPPVEPLEGTTEYVGRIKPPYIWRFKRFFVKNYYSYMAVMIFIIATDMALDVVR